MKSKKILITIEFNVEDWKLIRNRFGNVENLKNNIVKIVKDGVI